MTSYSVIFSVMATGAKNVTCLWESKINKKYLKYYPWELMNVEHTFET